MHSKGSDETFEVNDVSCLLLRGMRHGFMNVDFIEIHLLYIYVKKSIDFKYNLSGKTLRNF